ncbi:hypothetical protein GGF46_002004 [Coemansia sp. RSA 552]|nr:hypothetical protein GGF46_002004 [Coemansia sp. RSA 552]
MTMAQPLNADVDVSLNNCELQVQLQLLSFLRSGSTKPDYGLCAKNAHGDGYSAGPFGFSTLTKDVLGAITNYKSCRAYKGQFDALVGSLANFLQAVTGTVDNLLNGVVGALNGLDGFCDTWSETAGDDYFKIAQLQQLGSAYVTPVLSLCVDLGVTLPLSKTVLLETAVALGLGDDPKQLGGLIAAVKAQVTADIEGASGSILEIGGFKVDEIEWIKKLLEVRASLDVEVGPLSVNVFTQLIAAGYYNLEAGVSLAGILDADVVLDFSLASKNKLGLALSKALFYDTAIFRGSVGGKNSLPGIISATKSRVKKSNKYDDLSSGRMVDIGGGKEVDELKWVSVFLDVRESLGSSYDKASIRSFRHLIENDQLEMESGIEVYDWSDKLTKITC